MTTHAPRALLAASLILSTLALGACSSGSAAYSRDNYTRTVTPASGLIVGRPTFDTPIALAGSNAVIIPFAVRSQKAFWQDSDPYTAGGGYRAAGALQERSARVSAMQYGGQVRWHNAIVRSLDSSQENAILDRRGIIGSWLAFGVYDSANNVSTPHGLAFVVVTEDTNRDGQMNDLDARVALVADPNGANVRAITPDDAQVWALRYDATNSALIIDLARDTNHDGRIDGDDVVMPHIWRRGVDERAVPLISDSMRGRVEQILR